MSKVSVPDNVRHVISPSGMASKYHEDKLLRREPEPPAADAAKGQSLAEKSARSADGAEAAQDIGPPISLVMESVPTYVPVNGGVPAAMAAVMPVNGAVPQAAMATPLAAAAYQPAAAAPVYTLPAAVPQGMQVLPAAPPQQAGFAGPADGSLVGSGVQAAPAIPLPTAPPLQPRAAAAPVALTAPAAGLPAADLPASAPAAKMAAAIPADPLAADPLATVPAAGAATAATAAAIPSAPSVVVSGVLPSPGNITNVLDVSVQKKISALHVLMFGLSVTIALFSSGLLACLLQGRHQAALGHQGKHQHLDASVPAIIARAASHQMSDEAAASRIFEEVARDEAAAAKFAPQGVESLPLGAEAMHERDVFPHLTTPPPPTTSRGRAASPEASCW